jgi:transposase
MAMGRAEGVQDDLMATWAEMPRSPGHAFYDCLQAVLLEAGFDAFVEGACKPYYAPRMGAPSLPPGRYFRMHMIGYFEGIDSERGIAWRCADSYSLREFLLLSNREKAPDHCWLSRTRSRLPHEAHEKVFGWVLKVVAERGLMKGERIGVDGSTMEANAALRTIVRRDTGESYRAMLTRMAQESGVEMPTAEDLARFDRKRKGKTLSNADWKSPTDPDARIAKMKDGTTHLAYKPEHAVDLDTGVVVAASIHPADEGDTTTLSPTLEVAERNLDAVGLAPSEEEPCVVVADKGYHARERLGALAGGVWKTRIAEPEPAKGYLRWHGDEAARKAVYANRTRLKSGIGRETMRRRGELVERSFAHILDRRGMRRAWLRGRENIHKRYLIHVAGFNLGVLMRALLGQGTPKEAADARAAFIFVLQTDDFLAFALIAVIDAEPAVLVITIGLAPAAN